jgi:ectoine hydroxylase-related dioxygenase (phytanoyl-CoA dioxygenase family)
MAQAGCRTSSIVLLGAWNAEVKPNCQANSGAQQSQHREAPGQLAAASTATTIHFWLDLCDFTETLITAAQSGC